jgi:hypothetical protein
MVQSCFPELWLACRYFKHFRQTVSFNQVTIPGNFCPKSHRKNRFIIHRRNIQCCEFSCVVHRDISSGTRRFVLAISCQSYHILRKNFSSEKHPSILDQQANELAWADEDFFSREQAKSECDWMVMSSVFVTNQSNYLFPCSRANSPSGQQVLLHRLSSE